MLSNVTLVKQIINKLSMRVSHLDSKVAGVIWAIWRMPA